MTYINIGRCLRVAQALRNVKNKDLADHFNVRPQQVIRWRNMQDMSVHRVQEIAEYHSMSFDQFIGLDDAEG